MIPQWGLDRKRPAHRRYTRSTKLSTTFFSPAFGMVADRFGVLWMVVTNP